jgi:cytochrome c
MSAKGMLAGIVVTLCDVAGTQAAGDVERGEVVFKKCYACHSVTPGENGLTGPNLFGVVGRAVANAPDFDYSAARETLPAEGYRRWTEAALDVFIAAPDDVVPGTAMTFVGLPDPEQRVDVIAYRARQRARPGKE